MIKTIAPASPYLTVSSFPGGPGYISPGSQAGQVRYNTNMNIMEVFDGTSWKNVEGHADIGLSIEATNILDWGRKKMAEEKEYELLAKDHPALKAALDELREAEAKLKVLSILCKEEK